jgi:IclR family transcriptional regulator, KDG regulon repressor
MPDRNHFIASAAGTLQLLEILGSTPRALPLSRLAERTGRPKGSVHRALATLVNVGFVEQNPRTSLYRLTLKMWRIGMAALADLDIVRVAQPHLDSLMSAADETVHLAMLDPSGDVIYVAKVESPRSIRVQTQLGKLNPSWCTATGRALLAYRPEVAAKVLSRPLKPSTPHTIVDAARIRVLLRDIARKGVAVTKGENHVEMGGIAAPIRQHSGEVVASCGVAIPIFRMDRKLVDRCVPLVVDAAAAISAKLGYEALDERRHGGSSRRLPTAAGGSCARGKEGAVRHRGVGRVLHFPQSRI